MKISGDTTKIYSDSVFGGISWANDNSKICFIGEVPEPVNYKNPWDDKKEEKKEGDHYLDEKFNLKEDFGEAMVGKRNPAIFVYDI